MKLSLIMILLGMGSLLTLNMAQARHYRHYRHVQAAQTFDIFGSASSNFGWQSQPLTRRQQRAQVRQQRYSNNWGAQSASYSGGSLHAGERCHAGDRDPIKCKLCAIYGEDNRTPAGMAAVAGVIETRLQSGHWGSNVCSVVHARGQFVGAWQRSPPLTLMRRPQQTPSSNKWRSSKATRTPVNQTVLV
jgi:hypothetical protein